MTIVPVKAAPEAPISAVVVPPGWKTMSSGKGVDLAHPEDVKIDWNDIAIALAMTCRFGGAVQDLSSFYSVAQHSVLVADLLHPSIAVYGLLHDCHEAYLGDDVTPKKRLMLAAVPEAAHWLEDLKHNWDLAIWKAAGIAEPDAGIQRAVREADQLALAIERNSLLKPAADDISKAAWAWAPSTPDEVISLSPDQAHGLFLMYLNRLIWPGRKGGIA